MACDIGYELIQSLRGQAELLARCRFAGRCAATTAAAAAGGNDGGFDIRILPAWTPVELVEPPDASLWASQPGGVDVLIRRLVTDDTAPLAAMATSTTAAPDEPSAGDADGGGPVDDGLAQLLALKAGLLRAIAAVTAAGSGHPPDQPEPSVAAAAPPPPTAAPPAKESPWRMVLQLLDRLFHQPVTTELLLASQVGAAVQALLHPAMPEPSDAERPLADGTRGGARTLLQGWRQVVAAECRQQQRAAAAAGEAATQRLDP